MNGRHSSAITQSEVLVDMTNFKEIKIVDGILVVQGGATQGMANNFLFEEKGKEYYSHFGSFIHPRVSDVSKHLTEAVQLQWELVELALQVEYLPCVVPSV